MGFFSFISSVLCCKCDLADLRFLMAFCSMNGRGNSAKLIFKTANFIGFVLLRIKEICCTKTILVLLSTLVSFLVFFKMVFLIATMTNMKTVLMIASGSQGAK